MSFGPGQTNSIFDALRPRQGQSLSRAAMATYSLDLVALLGLVLVLGGEGEAEFNAGPLGLAEAFRKAAGRLIVLHQAGRLNAPGAQKSVLPLLDTMVRAVSADEAEGSWHPKAVLARYAGRGGAEWRFWIGSRNLTGSADLDAGLLLVSGAGTGAKRIPGIALLASDLLAEAGWTAAELAEIDALRWACPPGVAVRRLVWRRPGQRKNFLTDQPLKRPDRIFAVSPFLNRTGLAALQAAVKAPMTLLTTRRAGSDCAPVEGVEFRIWSAPEPQAPVDLDSQQTAAESEFADPPPAGIHAKLLMTMKKDAAALLLGSANLTSRGLLGPNAEAGVWLDITDPALAASLSEFAASGMELVPEAPDAERQEEERKARDLDAVISRFLQRPLSLHLEGEGLFVSVSGGADDLLGEADFLASAFLTPERRTAWVPGDPRVRLLDTPPALSQQTALVVIEARSREDPTVRRSWTQRAAVEGLDFCRRDAALLARYIGAARFRAWLKAQLDGIGPSGAERWNDGGHNGGSWGEGGALGELFTLEVMLGKWTRNPAEFEARLPDILRMLASFRAAFEELPNPAERLRALQDLDEVTPFIEAVAKAAGQALP
jgi:hypothetical protein